MPFGEQFHIEIRKPQDPWGTHVNPDQWLKSTEDALRRVASVKAGRALLQAVLDSGFFISIKPLNWAACNAHGAGITEITPRGTFKGRVAFDASVFEEGSHCFKSRLSSKYNRGGHADEVLFHELVHALRGGLGVNRGGVALSGGLWRYNELEEFYAVVLTNIYISDETNKGSSGLRAGHRGKMPLESYFSKSLSFFASSTQVLPLLKQLRKDQEKLFDELAKVKAQFNPLHAMVKYPDAVERMSKARITREHEAKAESHQKAVNEKYLAEIRKSVAATKAQEQAEMEAAIRSALNASPEEIARQAGRLAAEAIDVLRSWR